MTTEPTPIPELDPEENLRADNELSALSLELQYGAKTHISGDAPPEVVQQFLAQVAAFEKERRIAATITLYQKIGSPPFASPDVLEPQTLPGELQRVLDLLEAHQIAVIRPDDLPDDVFYEFIVSELFPLEVSSVTPPGAIACFDYEDFHPNEEALIGQITEAFLLSLLYLESPFMDELLSENCRNDHDPISRTEALATIERFRARFSAFVPVGFKLEELIQQPSGTWQMFGICWEGTPHDGGPNERHEGLGVMQLAFEDGEWLVQGVKMPGFEF